MTHEQTQIPVVQRGGEWRKCSIASSLKQEVEAYRLTMDSYLAALAARYGEAEYEGDEIIGYRFECPVDDFEAALKQHQVKFRKDEGRGVYVIGVLPPDKS